MRSRPLTALQWAYHLACEAACLYGDVVALGEHTLVREGRVFWLVSASGWVVLGWTDATSVSMCGVSKVDTLVAQLEARLYRSSGGY